MRTRTLLAREFERQIAAGELLIEGLLLVGALVPAQVAASRAGVEEPLACTSEWRGSLSHQCGADGA